MPGRTIAIGDIHGCSISLRVLLDAISPSPADTIVTLGDYVDGGIDSRGVLDQLIDFEKRHHLVALLGNHEEMMLRARESSTGLEAWMQFGGLSTLASYGDERLDAVPRAHWEFLGRCRLFLETDTHIFQHANCRPEKPLAEQSRHDLLWLSLHDFVPGPHMSSKIAVVGHTPQRDGEVLDLGHLICIDTNCWKGGWLTALDIESGQVWQVNERGQVRR